MPIRDFLPRLVAKEPLSSAEAEQAMAEILSGEATPAVIGAFLTALRMKGETAEEIHGLARAMRSKVTRVDGGDPGQLVDTCGTGGDASQTFNISTAAAFVVAGCGVRVAKHGNRSITSRCGSADILEALGVRIDITPDQMGRSIREVGIGFLFAPALHPAMKHAMPVRRELGFRTAFNMLGPLTNPAGAGYQLVGAFSAPAAELMAGALARLGLKRGFVVHGSDGLDEATITGPTRVWEVRDGRATEFMVTPEDFGVERAEPGALRGGGVEENAALVRAVLNGEKGPRRDIVLVNAALALVAAGRAADYRSGVELAGESIDSGRARGALEGLGRFTQNSQAANDRPVTGPGR